MTSQPTYLHASGPSTVIVLRVDDHKFTTYQTPPSAAGQQLAIRPNPKSIEAAIAENRLQVTGQHQHDDIKAINWDLEGKLSVEFVLDKPAETIMRHPSAEVAAKWAQPIIDKINPNAKPAKRRVSAPFNKETLTVMGTVSVMLIGVSLGSFLDEPVPGQKRATGFAGAPLWGVLTFDLAVLTMVFGLLLLGNPDITVVNPKHASPPKTRITTYIGWAMLIVCAACFTILGVAMFA